MYYYALITIYLYETKHSTSHTKCWFLWHPDLTSIFYCRLPSDIIIS